MNVDKHIKNLRAAADENRVDYGVLMDAVDELREPKDIQAYYKVVKKTTRQAILHDKKIGKETRAVKLLKEGKRTLAQLTDALAHDYMSYLLSHYNNPEVHTAWKRAVPSLYPNGRLQNMLETALDI